MVTPDSVGCHEQKWSVFHLLAFVFCRGKYAISVRHRNIFLPSGRQERSDWEMFVVTFLFPWLFSTKAVPGSIAEGWECIFNPALWALSSSPFFPSARQDKGWILILIFLGLINTWDVQQSIGLIFIPVSCTLLVLSRSLRSSVIELVDISRLQPMPKTTNISLGSRHSVLWIPVAVQTLQHIVCNWNDLWHFQMGRVQHTWPQRQEKIFCSLVCGRLKVFSSVFLIPPLKKCKGGSFLDSNFTL